MRALIVTTPQAGHINPLCPLTRALLDQGDEVFWAAGEDPGGVITSIGAEVCRVGRTVPEWMDELARRVRGRPGDGVARGRLMHYMVPRLFGEIGATDMIDGLIELGQRIAPDVVIFDTAAYAAPLAAHLLGVPSVHHLKGPVPPADVVELVNDAVASLWLSFGADPPQFAGLYRGTTIKVLPPALDARKVPAGKVLAMRSVDLPARKGSRSSERPLVYFTLGTVFSARGLEMFRAVIDALTPEPVELVVTVGDAVDPTSLGPTASNVRIERFVPQADLLPDCTVVIHHGGAGTMMGALVHGVPQLVLPQGADNLVNARLVEGAGAGAIIDADSLTAETVLQGFHGVLGGEVRAAAEQAAAQLVAMPGPTQVARSLAELRTDPAISSSPESTNPRHLPGEPVADEGADIERK